MPASSGCLVREGQPGVDDEAVAALMVNTSRGRLTGLPTTTASTSRRPIHHWSGTAWSTSARRLESCCLPSAMVIRPVSARYTCSRPARCK
jgi:hypothetical protein